MVARGWRLDDDEDDAGVADAAVAELFFALASARCSTLFALFMTLRRSHAGVPRCGLYF